MVSLFFLLQIKGERPPFIGKGRPLSLVYFQCEIASHKGRNLKTPNLGSSIEFMSVTNTNDEVKRRYEK